MIVLLVVAVSASELADVDLWRHLRFGADMITNGGPIRRDPYAYSIRNLPWISHEWLSEIIFAWTYARLGVVGLKLLRLTCAAIAITSLAAAVAEASTPLGVQLGVMIPVSIGLIPEMQFRPQIFTYALLSVMVWLLARDNYRGHAPLWIAIPMLALWANLHGGFVVGLAALGVYASVAGAQEIYRGRGLRRALKLAAVVALAASATLITPYGVGTWGSAMRTIARPPMLNHVSEWQSLLSGMTAVWHLPGLAVLFDVALIVVFAGFAASVAIAPDGDDLAMVAVGAMMLVATFTALRNIPLGLIGCAAPLARHAALAWARFTTDRSSRLAADAHASAATQGIIAIVAIALALKTGVLSRRLDADRRYPTSALAFMSDHALHGNVLCDYEWAGYVLFHCAPGSRVFIDGRYEMIYPERIAHDFIEFYDALAGGRRVLDSYPTELVLIGAKAPARKIMDASSAWTLVYRDEAALLYARKNSAAAKIPGIPIKGRAAAFRFP